MDLGGMGWAIQTIIGGFLLAAVLFWAMRKNKQSTPEEVDRTEAATRDLYKQEDRDHRGEDDNVA